MIVDGKQKGYEIDSAIFHCGTSVTMGLIGGKWKCIILWYLRHGPTRFSNLKRLIPDITEKMLSLQLKALQADGFVHREVLGKKPPLVVHYSLTEFGESLLPVIKHITDWGIRYAEAHGKIIDITG